jgi:hypothetical protein
MAETRPRSASNMVFIVLLALALAGGLYATYEMVMAAVS